ncbi:MAG: GTPase domain-containing protein [Planctomycetes bacterium]|nr:GTPase domain-containing protein [Planctomycetota bacterium]
MVQINFALKEVNCKVVYYGPGLSGKTTNLEVVHSKAPRSNVGELTSIATEGDRTLFFDFLPLNLGPVAGMTTKFQIYTVPGQVYYNSTRKLVLQGADGIVFVADSRRGKMDENLESLQNLEDNLEEYGMDMQSTPLVFQYNKRDLPDVYGIEEMQEKLNKLSAPYFEAVAVTGEGVFPTLKKLSQMVLEGLNRQQSSMASRPQKKAAEAKAEASQGQRVRVPTPVPVAAGPGRSAPAAPHPVRTAAGPKGPPPAAPPPRHARPEKPGVKVVREPVTNSPGVKPIERKSPAAEPAVRKRPAVKPPAPPPAAQSKRGLWLALALAGLGALLAVLYFSGSLTQILGI